LNSPQIGDYLWLVPPFVFVNGIFLALNGWNSGLNFSRDYPFQEYRVLFDHCNTDNHRIIDKKSSSGLITGSLTGQSVATFILAGQIWRDDRNLIRKSLDWKKMYEILKRYSKFPLVDSFSALMNSISWQLPAFLLAAFFSPAIVGFYSLVLDFFRFHEFDWQFDFTGIFPEGIKSSSSGTLSSLVKIYSNSL
jgi:hypothetical protein